MLAGTLSSAGYNMGQHPYRPRNSNPKGFFEDHEINAINEDILATVAPPRPRGFFGRFYRSRPGRGQRWLAAVPLGTQIPRTPSLERRIAIATAKAPFCFKDPRLCYTLPAWRPYVDDAVLLVVFREPGRTALSILKECRDVPYLHTMAINFRQAVRVWTLMYQHVLDHHRHWGQWVFVHFDQVLDGSALPNLEMLLGTKVDRQFADPALKRSPLGRHPGSDATTVYRVLCKLAGYAQAR